MGLGASRPDSPGRMPVTTRPVRRTASAGGPAISANVADALVGLFSIILCPPKSNASAHLVTHLYREMLVSAVMGRFRANASTAKYKLLHFGRRYRPLNVPNKIIIGLAEHPARHTIAHTLERCEELNVVV